MMRNNLQRYNIFSRYANNVLIYRLICKGGGLINRKIYLLMSKNYRSVIVFSHLRGSPSRILRNRRAFFSVYASACVAHTNRNTTPTTLCHANSNATTTAKTTYQSTQPNALYSKRQSNTTHSAPCPLSTNPVPRRQRYKPTPPTPTAPRTPNHAPFFTHTPLNFFPF